MTLRNVAIALTVAFALGVTSCSRETASSDSGVVKADDGQVIGQAAPNFSLKNDQGQPVQLSDFEGKVVLVNFWATWCGPCKIEMPWFIEFQRTYKDQGFSVVAISLDEDGWDSIRPYAEDLKPNFPVLLGDEKTADSFGGIAALPTTFIIGKDGKIASQHMGLISKGDYAEEIEELL